MAFSIGRIVTGTTDTPTTADDGGLIQYTSASAKTIALTNSSWIAGRSAFAARISGGGAATFTGGAGVTVNGDTSIASGLTVVCQYTASNTWEIVGTDVLPVASGGTGATTASGARTALGLGTIATQDASSVTITGGSVTGITDLAVADGGTGASTAAGARANLLVAGPIYTPEQFGAARNGTTDDSAAIQAADNAAALAGGMVWFQSGVYLVNSAVAKHPGTQWEGPGGNSAGAGNPGAVLQAGTSGDVVTITGPLDNRRGGIHGIRFLASATAGTAIYIDNLIGQRIDDCFIGNFDIGIHGHDSAAIYQRRNYIFGGRIGYLLDNCTDTVATDGCQFAGSEYGVDIIGGAAHQFTGCRPQVSGEACLRANNTGYLQVIGGHVDSASIAGGSGAKMGIELIDCKYSRISDVTFYANDTRHIYCRNTAGQTMLGVSFIGNTFQGTAKGIEFAATEGTVRRIVVADNVQDNFSALLLEVPAPASGTFQRLTVSGNEAQAGVSIDAAVTSVFGDHANRTLGTTLGFFGVTPATRAAAYTATNVTTDRSFNANATTLDELADVVGTLIADLKTYGLLQ